MKFSRVVHRVAFVTGLSIFLARRKRVRRILMLHGVGDAAMPAQEFAEGIEWLSRRQRVVALGTMVDDIAQGRPVPPGGEVAITFDDGLRNQLSLAYPVLERHGTPATFFVCPGLIEGRRWIWNQEARERLRELQPEALGAFAATISAPIAEVEALVARMKTLPYAARLEAEQRLRDLTPAFAPTEATRLAYDPLAWDDFPRIDPGLVTIGSHTVSHPILTRIDDQHLERELTESRRVLEDRLGRSVDLFCYPNGSMDQRVREVAERVYRAAVTTDYGFVHDTQRLHGLRRIPVSPSLPLLAWRMHRPTA